MKKRLLKRSFFRVFFGDEILRSVGIIINHYEDPYQTTSIMESRRDFFRGSLDVCWFMWNQE